MKNPTKTATSLLLLMIFCCSAGYLHAQSEAPAGFIEADYNMITWFEIPCQDLERGTGFYNEIFGFDMTIQDFDGFKMVYFPMSEKTVSGALIQADDHNPAGLAGPVIYLNTNGEMDEILSRVTDAGGKVVLDRMNVSPEIGDIALIMDTEGNRIGLHEMPEGAMEK